MKNVKIMGVHKLLGEGVTKNYMYGELPKKGGLDNLQGAWQKNREEGVFEGTGGGGLIPRCKL